MPHVPVLLQETLQYLKAESGTKFIDCTVGGGGHTKAILNLNPQAKVLGIDWDQTSLDKLKQQFVREGLDQRSVLVSGNYTAIDQFAGRHGFVPVDGILIDLGFSSLQLDEAARGFSFQSAGPLDMRYSSANELTAGRVVNHYSPEKLEKIFSELGEEKFARRISAAIARARQTVRIDSTTQLAEIIRSAMPLPIRFKASESLRRIFQALRIEVNSELENLKLVLPKCLKLLQPGGRLVIISFHSLEDRIVKEFFNQEAKDCICPPEFPTCVCDKVSSIRILTRKPVTAAAAEAGANPRSKSAKLRAAEKLTAK